MKILFQSVCLLIICIFTGIPTLGLEVDVDEVRTGKKVEFENYRGAYQYQDTEKDIKNIGADLSVGLEKAGDNVLFRLQMKYSVIHAVSKDEPEKYSADIISIDRDASIGHINAINLIISGYLEKKYAYSRENAKALSLFITYYNAVYRGNTGYFGSKYKKIVMDQVTAGNAGLSTKYYQWPGASKIIIPLTEESKKGKLDSIDPFIISDKNVTDKVRKDDKNIEDRKTIIAIKEDVVKKEKEDIVKNKKKADEEKKEIDTGRKIIDEKKDKIIIEKKEIIKEKEEVKKIKDEIIKKEKEGELVKKEEKIKEAEKTIKKEENTLKEKEGDLKKKTEVIKDKEKETSKKEETVKEEKKVVEKDELKKDIEKNPEKAREKLAEKSEKLEKKEKELEKKEEALKEKKPSRDIEGENLYYIKTDEWVKNGHYNNELFLIHVTTMKIKLKSPVPNIGGRKFDIFAGGIVIITRTGPVDSKHRLTLLNKDSLEAVTFGTDGIFFRSFVEIRENFIYAVIMENDKFYLGKFDEGLKLKSKSKEEVHGDTFITFFNEYIYMNNRDKRIIVLKKEDLSFVDLIKP